jgi:hypothetical protein
MVDLTLLHPKVREKSLKLLDACKLAGYPMTIFCGTRTYADQAKIYPLNPKRWSNHLWGGAVDLYPVEYTTWGKNFSDNLTNWPHWPEVQRLSTRCRFDKIQKFQESDKCHYQYTFGMSEHVMKFIFECTVGTEEAKRSAVWEYINIHLKRDN